MKQPNAAIAMMVATNILSILIYGYQYYHTGDVITTSGNKAQGYHEIPAMIALAGMLHQLYFSKRGGWHPLVGQISIVCTVLLLGAAIANVKKSIVLQYDWVEELPMSDGWAKQTVLVWNEAVNIHQYYLYGVILLYLMGNGVVRAKSGDYKSHEQYMQSVAMYLLGPLFVRFAYNHCTNRELKYGVALQVIPYTILMIMFYSFSPVTRLPLQYTLGFAIIAAVYFVRNQTSALEFLLLVG